MRSTSWKRKTIVLTILALFVGSGVIPSTIGITEEKITFKEVKSPGYIQNLIDNASNGDTIFIPSGTYYENIIINKSISLIGENKDDTIIDGGGNSDVVSISAGKVNISGFTFQNSGNENYNAGIDIKGSSNSITGNIISNNSYGIIISASDNNNIADNIISNNGNGIFLFGSKFNIIKGNTISNNGRGIFLFFGSKFNIIKGNTISNNGDGISLSRLPMTVPLGGFDFNIILKNNFIDNEQDAYFENSFFNRWISNYWNRPRILPKGILGKYKGEGGMGSPGAEYSLFNFDWRPALKPYDIKVGI